MTDLCTECGHRALFHGDRAVTACDGGYTPIGANEWMMRQYHTTGDRRVCTCTGWQSR